MKNNEDHLLRSIEIVKSGFENAQGRITFIDTKVGIAVGLLVVLLPIPLVAVNWLTGLQGEVSKIIFGNCANYTFLSLVIFAGILSGMLCAFVAILRGISCLSPRGPKGYGKIIPFQDEWKPNVLFPIHKPEKAKVFYEHIQKIHAGVDLNFLLCEYDHQLHQLGRILHEKFAQMAKCFFWLNCCLICYGIAIVSGAILGLIIILKQT